MSYEEKLYRFKKYNGFMFGESEIVWDKKKKVLGKC